MYHELRAIFIIASLYAVRILGLFMILPTIPFFTKSYTVGLTQITLAIGSYALAQAVCQIPIGILSDKFGRKPLLLIGYTLFILGSLIAYYYENIYGLYIGRILQGAGAVGGVLLALVSDVSAEQRKSSMMAIIGMFIGISFILALLFGSWIASSEGVQYIFLVNAVSGVFACFLVLFLPKVSSGKVYNRPSLQDIKKSLITPFNIGIAINHVIQMMLWVAIPMILLNQFGVNEYQWFLVSIAAGAFLLMMPLLKMAKIQLKLSLISSLLILVMSMAGFYMASTLPVIVIATLLFFIAFSFFETKLPSLASSQCNFLERGMNMGIFSSWQFGGIFLGSWLGGYLVEEQEIQTVFLVATFLLVFWLFVIIFCRIEQYKSVVISQKENKLATKTLSNIEGVEDVVYIENYGAYYVKVRKDFNEDALNIKSI